MSILVIADRVKETTSSTGTGTFSLSGAVPDFQSFVTGIGTTNTTYYSAADGISLWEVGIGTVTAGSPNTLSRTTVLASSSGGAKVSFTVSPTVICTSPAILAGSIINTSNTGYVLTSNTNAYPSWTSTSGANSIMARDANQNTTVNNLFTPIVTTAASGSAVIMTAASAPNQVTSGLGGQVYNLPDATTLPIGANFLFNNNQTSGSITVYNYTGVTGGVIATVLSGGLSLVTLTSVGTAAGTWDVHVQAPSNVQWSTNTLIYPGTISSATWGGSTIAANHGGTGVANNIASTLAITGSFGTTLTVSGTTALTLPTSGNVISSVTQLGANPVTGTPSSTTYLRGDGTWSFLSTTLTANSTLTSGFANGSLPYSDGSKVQATAAGVASGYQFLQSAGAASPTWVQIPSFKDVAAAPSSPAPIEGDRFFDNTSGINYTYITDANGSQWVETTSTGAGSSVYTKTTFTATASQTTFTVAYSVGYVDVYLNGVKLTVTDYTATNGSSVVLGVAAALNDIVETIAWSAWSATNTAIGAGTGTSLVLSGAATASTFNSSTLAVPTRQTLTSVTSATYTAPANVRQLRIRMVGGGNGGSGSTGAAVVGNSAAGLPTTFGTTTAIGGSNSATLQGPTGGSGGTNGTGSNFIRVAGNPGGPGTNGNTAVNTPGGNGGASAFGGAGVGGLLGAGGAAAVNSGSGGGGAQSNALNPIIGAPGGGSGEYVEFIVNSPAATYTYQVGAGRSGASSTQSGGSGADGIIIVDEFY